MTDGAKGEEEDVDFVKDKVVKCPKCGAQGEEVQRKTKVNDKLKMF